MSLDRAALDAHLANLPPLADDPAYLVLADWLQTQNHPWGELIVMQHRAQQEPALLERAAELIARHTDELFGAIGASLVDLEWHLGFVRKAVLVTHGTPEEIAGQLTSLFDRPVMRMLETLVIDPAPKSFPTWRDWDSSREHIVEPFARLPRIAKAVPAHVTRLGLGRWPAGAASAYVRMPRFDHLSEDFPALRALSITGMHDGESKPLVMPELVELGLHFAHADEAALGAFARSELPKLERLSLWLGGETSVIVDSVHPPDDRDEDDPDAERYPAEFSAADLEAMDVDSIEFSVAAYALREIFHTKRWPLTHLSFGAGDLPPHVLQETLSSPVVAALRTLDLSHAGIRDSHLPVLREAAGLLRQLESIDLSGNEITHPVAQQLRELLPNATIDSDIEPQPPFMFRFVATME